MGYAGSGYSSAVDIFDDEIPKMLEYLRYKGTEIVGENWYSLL